MEPDTVTPSLMSAMPQIEEFGYQVPTTATTAMPCWRRLFAFRRAMNDRLIARSAEVDLVMLGLVSRNNVLLVGPPGVAKSMTCEALCSAISGATYFYQLLSRASYLADVMGPIDIPAIHRGEGRRIDTKGYLPEAHLAVCDEIWNADGALLNGLLRALNENEYFNEGRWNPMRLIMTVAAANQFPDIQQRPELRAVFDRFILRAEVLPLTSRADIHQLYELARTKPNPPSLQGLLSLQDVQHAQAAVAAVPWSEEAIEAMLAIDDHLDDIGIRPSDRRRTNVPKIAQAQAFLAGSDTVEKVHLVPLKHVLWTDPINEPRRVATIVTQIAAPHALEFEKELSAAEAVLQTVDKLSRKIRSVEENRQVTGEFERIRLSIVKLRELAKAPTTSPEEHARLQTLARYSDRARLRFISQTIPASQFNRLVTQS